MHGIPIFPLLKLRMDLLAEVDLSAAYCRRTGHRPWVFEELSDLLLLEGIRLEAPVLWGGYLEERDHYLHSGLFEGQEPRNIHLGLDFWAVAETEVFAPWDGVVHSMQDNDAERDYGPTIILKHRIHGQAVHSLYGHLSRASLKMHKVGQIVEAGALLGWMGRPEENVGWPPHLHFQLVHDLEGHSGDYPGVAAKSQLTHYQNNCPDPRIPLGL